MPDGSWGKSLALAFDKGKYVSAFAVIGKGEQTVCKVFLYFRGLLFLIIVCAKPIYVSNSEWPNLGLGRHPQRQSCSIEAEAPVALRTYLSPVAIALVMLISYNITDRRYQQSFPKVGTLCLSVKCDLSKNFPMLLHTAYNALTTSAIIILLVWIT
ncbi:hypothetical protein T02_4243 [Trichinella nativa]|uniref:Uncharacterized protein n=1 Tax=Trichinella nativa TaxID=6335 RepID=A0A0V1L0A3_9BILA|nr:hypothetical protein T02_4243 [Trichinella nativa]